MSFYLEEMVKVVTYKTFVRYEDIPEPFRGIICDLLDNRFCDEFAKLDGDGCDDGGFRLERIEIGHVAKALDTDGFSDELRSRFELIYDFMKKMNIQFIECR